MVWPQPFPSSLGLDDRSASPDITTLVNDAISLNNGILKLLVFYPGVTSGVARNDYYSIEATVTALSKPHLFFKAF